MAAGGDLTTARGDRPAPAGRRRQAEIFTAGFSGRKPRVPVAPERLEAAARAAMGRRAAAYVLGGAGIERTMAANRAAFDRHRLLPRMMSGAARRDLGVELFGARLPLPFLLAPVGVLDLVHPDADIAAARAAAAEGVAFVTSCQSSRTLEDIARAGKDAPRWFQLYWSAENALTESFARRAEAAGYGAIVVTLDTTELGWRPRDLDLGYLPFMRARGIANYLSDPVFRTMPVPAEAARPGFSPGVLASVVEMMRAWRRGPAPKGASPREAAEAVRRFIAIYSRPSLSWVDLPFLRSCTRLPILLKGILHPDDARRALDAGIDGLIVSNHGGRQVDGAVAALDMLPKIVEAAGDRVPVLFDSGIRTGSDMVKALALGARAVLIGRPYVYGLALAGEMGVREVIRNLAAELDLTLGLVGQRSVSGLNRSVLLTSRLGSEA